MNGWMGVENGRLMIDLVGMDVSRKEKRKERKKDIRAPIISRMIRRREIYLGKGKRKEIRCVCMYVSG